MSVSLSRRLAPTRSKYLVHLYDLTEVRPLCQPLSIAKMEQIKRLGELHLRLDQSSVNVWRREMVLFVKGFKYFCMPTLGAMNAGCESFL